MTNLGRRHVRDSLRRVLHCDFEIFFDIVADDIVYEVRHDPGWPRVVRGRTDLMDQFKGYVGSIRLSVRKTN